MKKILKVKLKPSSYDEVKCLRKRCMGNPVRFSKQWIQFSDSPGTFQIIRKLFEPFHPYCYVYHFVVPEHILILCQLNPLSFTPFLFYFLIIVPVELQKLDRFYLATVQESPELVCKVKRANPLPVFAWFFQYWSCRTDDKCPPLERLWMPKFDFRKVNFYIFNLMFIDAFVVSNA